MTTTPSQHPSVGTARETTDDRLASERRQADRALERKLLKPEAEANDAIERARIEADESIAEAADQAQREAAAPTGTSSSVRKDVERQIQRVENVLPQRGS